MLYGKLISFFLVPRQLRIIRKIFLLFIVVAVKPQSDCIDTYDCKNHEVTG